MKLQHFEIPEEIIEYALSYYLFDLCEEEAASDDTVSDEEWGVILDKIGDVKKVLKDYR